MKFSRFALEHHVHSNVTEYSTHTSHSNTGTLTCVRESWTENTASCVESSCSASPGIDDELPGTCVGTASGGTCAFQCESTHTPSGSPSCLRGEWTLNGAECILIEQCGVPAVENGYYDATGWTPAEGGKDLDSSKINCNAGYSKNNSQTTPVCTCPEFSQDPCQELRGWCSEISCPNVDVTGGSAVASASCSFTGTDAYAINSPQCQYSCGNGFYIDAVSDTTTCGLDGVWPSAPTCAEYQCPAISVTASQEFAGATCNQDLGASSTPICTFHCEEGWEIDGSADVSCDFFGVWGTYPTCVRSSCASYQVTNGVEVANGVTGDLVTVSCAQGYTGPLELDNGETGGIVECQADRTFTSFTCEPNECQNVTIPLSRDYSTSGVTGVTGDVVTVECMEPFASGTSCCHSSAKCENTISLLSKRQPTRIQTLNTRIQTLNTRIPTPKYQQVRSKRLAKRTVHFPLLSVLESRCAL